MIYHVNGWPFIEEYLKRRTLHQTDLAKLLKITPAAISQAKSGRSLFSAAQLSAVADFLAFDERTRRLFYGELFAARMGEEPPPSVCAFYRPGRAAGRIPCCPLPLLLDYAPAAEGIREFVESHQTETLPAEEFPQGCVAVRSGLGARAGLPAGSVLALAENAQFPMDRCTVLGCDKEGLFVAHVNRDRGEGVISFHQLPALSRKVGPWHFRREPDKIRFLLPVVTLKLSCD